MAENALLAVLELRQRLACKWLPGCAMRLWSGLVDWGIRLRSRRSAGGLSLAYRTWD